MESSFKKNVLLTLCTLLLLATARLYAPPLGLIALAPIFCILSATLQERKLIIHWLIFATLVFTFTGIITLKEITLTPIYGVGLSAAISLFLITQTFSKNRLGLFTIIFFWLALDYLMLKIAPESAQFFLSSLFDGSIVVSWSRSTGNLGITGWIVLSNILFYYALFEGNGILQGNIRWLTLTYAMIIVALPIITGLFLTNELTPVTTIEMIQVYDHGVSTVESDYARNGEWLGRTAAWVAILILTYSLIKRKVK